MTDQQSLEWDANTVMEQIHMAESRHMQMGALCSYLLQYPDMTIREFFAMASEEIREQEEELGYYEQRTITRTQILSSREDGR